MNEPRVRPTPTYAPAFTFVLNFNMAYNPWCAYGAAERYVCPVTPAENRLAVRIEAGERGYKLREGPGTG